MNYRHGGSCFGISFLQRFYGGLVSCDSASWTNEKTWEAQREQKTSQAMGLDFVWSNAKSVDFLALNVVLPLYKNIPWDRSISDVLIETLFL